MRTNMDEIARDLSNHLKLLRAETGDNQSLDHIECFVAVALRVMAKTNPSKVRDCARTVEIKARMDGASEVNV